MSMAVEPDSAGVRFPPPFVYLGALLLGLAAERFVTLRSFGIDGRLLVATGALLFVAGAAMMLAAAGLFRRLGTNVPPSQPTTLIATTGPYRWTRNPMYLGMALIYAGLAIGFDGPIACALLPLVLIAIQTQVIAREERYLEAKFGDDYRRYKAEVRRRGAWIGAPSGFDPQPSPARIHSATQRWSGRPSRCDLQSGPGEVAARS